MHKYIIISLLSITMLHADPWGKDADLVFHSTSLPRPSPFFETMIVFHQLYISPADGPRSHFLPCSSQYTLDAMHKYGFFHGFLMGCDRLLRENNEDWIYRKVLNEQGVLIKLDMVK